MSNKLQPRARFFHYPTLAEALAYDDQKSSFVHSLNGTWDFCYLASPREIPETFLKGEYQEINWEKIQVPGHLELQGFGQPNYTNVPLSTIALILCQKIR